MPIVRTDIENPERPTYRTIADALERAIVDGKIAPGRQLPPVRQMARQLGVTIGTVNRAYTLAQSRGLLSGEVGRGTFVQRSALRDSRLSIVQPPRPNAVGLVINQPAPVLDDAEARRFLGAIHHDTASLLGRYPPTPGRAEQRAALASWIGRTGLDVPPERVLLTAGVHGAIAASVLACLRPGDTVLIDQLSYPGARDLLGTLRMRVEPVAIDEHGIRPDALQASFRVSGAKAVLTCPTLHNPPGLTMPEARRAEIARIIAAADALLIEDDVYGHLPAERPAPIAAWLPERTILVSGLSKCLAPGFRLGYLVAPPSHLGALTAAVHDLVVTAAPIQGALFAAWLADGTADEILTRIRRATERRRELAGSVLGVAPAAGALHLWLPLPPRWTADRLVEEAATLGLQLPRTDAFVVGRHATPRMVRLALGSAATEAELRDALVRLARLMAAPPPRGAPVI